MAAPCFISWNAVTSALSSPMVGTASSAVSGTVKTLLQIAPAKKIRVVEWGYIFASIPAGPFQMELVETGTIFATVTTGSISNYNDVTGSISSATTGVNATGFNASAEGSVVASRLLAQTEDNALYFKQQFPLGREPEVGAGAALRVRGTPSTSAAVTVLTYVIWEE
jgi:hypothetical protein